MTDVLLQEGGSPQTEQQLSEMIRDNLLSAIKDGKLSRSITLSYIEFP